MVARPKCMVLLHLQCCTLKTKSDKTRDFFGHKIKLLQRAAKLHDYNCNFSRSKLTKMRSYHEI